MTCTEDQFRSILAAEAADITADSVPPLSLAASQQPSRRAARRQSRPRRGRLSMRLVAPLAAAAAVIAVIAVATSLAPGDQPPRPNTTRPASGLLHAVPRYYLGIDPSSTEAVVRDTLTGAIVASARPPHPYSFHAVAAAADDRTFILEGIRTPPGGEIGDGALFRARLDPADHTLTVTPLNIRLTQAEVVGLPFALSADGAELAVGVSSRKLHSPRSEILVYSLTDHSVRTWTGLGYLAQVAWGRQGELAFWYIGTYTGPGSIRILNTNADSRDFLKASRIAIGKKLPGLRTYQPADAFAMTGSGSTITVVISNQHDQPPFAGAGKIAEFSAVTGAQVRPFTPVARDDVKAIAWFSPSGTVLVALAPRNPGGAGRHNGYALGVLSGRQFVPIPRAPAAGFVDLAF